MSNIEDIVNSQKDESKLHSIDDQVYYFEVWIYNQIVGQDPFQVPYLFIDSLSIEESIEDFNTSGWIVLNNDYEILERFFPNTSKAPFIFRTDGRNKIRLQIYPVFETSQDFLILDDSNKEADKELRKKWEIDLDCVVYDVEDIDVPNAKNKKKKFYFHDERYQIFSEKNIEWSTAVEGKSHQFEGTAPYINTAILPDHQRCCRANYALRSIIEEAGISPDSKSLLKVGGGTIDDPSYTIQGDRTIWDIGTEDNNIFYTSPAYNTVLDDIDYVLKYCGTKERGPSFLSLTRWAGEGAKVFELKSLKSYFDDAKTEQVEHLIIEDGVLEVGGDIKNGYVSTMKPYFPKAPNDVSNNVQNFTSGKASRIHSYRFSPMVASDDSRICTTPLHNFDFSKGSFNIMFNGNKIDDVHISMTDYAKDGLHSFVESSNKAHILMNINQTKKKGIMINNHFEPLQFMPKFLPQTNMIRDLLFLNECICFTVTGLTIRSPGRFLFIDKLTSNGDPDPHADRFLGQWFIIRVVHLFQQGRYISEVVATKVDTFKKIWDMEDAKY